MTSRRCGYAAIEAADGASGLEVLESDVHIDLLITDIGLSGGMNGRQMTHAARQRRSELRVLFITGYPEGAGVGKWPSGTGHAGVDQTICDGRPGQPDQVHACGNVRSSEGLHPT